MGVGQYTLRFAHTAAVTMAGAARAHVGGSSIIDSATPPRRDRVLMIPSGP